MGCFHENGIGAIIIGCDGGSFIQEAMKILNADSLVVASSSNIKIDIEDAPDCFEETFESTAIVGNDQSAKADFLKGRLR